jgi:hypothetical protein
MLIMCLVINLIPVTRRQALSPLSEGSDCEQPPPPSPLPPRIRLR